MRIKLSDIPATPDQVLSSPSNTIRIQRLPLADKTWEDFERHCVRLTKKSPDTKHSQSYGVKGQNQEGIDLYVRKRSGRYEVW